MDTILEIAETPIEPVVHTNKFQLDLKFMHGDADGYTNRTLFYKTSEDSLQKLKYFLAIFSFISDDTIELWTTAHDWFKAHTSLDNEAIVKYADSFSDIFYEPDLTNEGRRALFEDAILTYWDNAGKQFPVKWHTAR